MAEEDTPEASDFLPGGESGGGSSSGGTSSSSGTSSSGGAPAGPSPEQQKAEREALVKRKEAFRGLLHRYRIPVGPFGRMIDKAAKDEWNQDEFLFSVSKEKDFRQMFQGIGTLFKEGLSFGSAITEWRQRAAAYKDVHQTLDMPMKLNRRKVGLLIKNNVSPDEYAQRLLIAEDLAQQEATRNSFNAVRAQMGLPAWDDNRWKKLVTTRDRALWTQYEAARLYSAGLNLGVEEAISVAQQVGAATELYGGIGELVSKVKSLKNFIGQELEQSGIKDSDLILLESGADPRGISPQVERIVTQREALGRQTGGSPRGRNATGAPSRFASPVSGL